MGVFTWDTPAVLCHQTFIADAFHFSETLAMIFPSLLVFINFICIYVYLLCFNKIFANFMKLSYARHEVPRILFFESKH